MKRLFLIAFILSAFSALTSAAYSQIVVKDFNEVDKQAKIQVQNVTTVQSRAKLPYVADITKLKRTADLSPEERKALDETSIPDTLYVRQLKQQDQVLFQKGAALKTAESDDKSPNAIYLKRWFPVEKKVE